MSIEIIGTLASVMVLFSFLMKGERNIRIVNIVGAALFFVYGIYINAFSVWFLNGGLLIIHIIRLLMIRKEGETCQKEGDQISI